MKSKRFWFRSILILGLSVGVLGSLIAASPAWISDWIFRTGQTVFSVYNSSSQLIETVDNRNKARRQYGALTVDGALYANSTINATGAINLGGDVSLSRSAADVLTTPDSIVSATHTITGGKLIALSISRLSTVVGLTFNSLGIPYIPSDYLGIGSGATNPSGYYANLLIYAASPQLSVLDNDTNAFIGLEQKSNVASLVRDNADILTIGTKVNSQTTAVVPQVTISTDGKVGIGTTSPSEELYVVGDIYSTANVSALTFTDRTPGSPEDALSEIKQWKIVGEKVDHKSLGVAKSISQVTETGFEITDKIGNTYNSITKKAVSPKREIIKDISALSGVVEKMRDGTIPTKDYQVKAVTTVVLEEGRDISKTLSVLSRAIQQLSERLDKLEGR